MPPSVIMKIRTRSCSSKKASANMRGEHCLVWLALILLLASCASERTELPRQEPTPIVVQSDGTIGDFYKRYTGTIAGQNVTVHLIMVDNMLSGSYYYDKIGIPITLWSGVYDARSKSYEMSEEDRYREGPRWLVGFDGLRLLGTWTDNKKTHKIELIENSGSDL